ncbi:hypothetical protein Tco_0934821 [Tanacetum coccineum]
MVHQEKKAILDLALQFDNACTTKEDLRKAYEKYNHIPQEIRALIDTFLKEGYDKDYELNLSMYRNAAKLEKQMNAKLAWIHEKLQQSLENPYREALRETLEENNTMDEKAVRRRFRQNKLMREYFMEFGVMRIDSDYESSD